MKTILIVDDEMLVRAGLRSIVDWNANGYDIIGEAASGHNAMELIKKKTPDILLTDLIMDNGDGLELIEWCKTNYPNVSIIVLSNYTDYDKVRTAMKLGAKDYLFKLTTEGKEILQVLDSLQIETRPDPMSQLIERNAFAIRNQLLSDLLNNKVEDHEVWKNDFRAVSGAFSIDQPYSILYIQLGDFALLTGSRETENAAATTTVEKSIEDHFCKMLNAQFFRYKLGGYYVLVNLQKEASDSTYKASLQNMYYNFAHYCERFLGLRSDCVWYGPCCSFDQLLEGARQCKRAIRYFFYLPKGAFLHAQDISFDDILQQGAPEIPHIIQLLDSGSYADVLKATEAFFDKIEIYKGDVQKARELINDLYVHLWDTMRKKNLFLEEFTDGNDLSLYEAIHSYNYLIMIRHSFLEALKSAFAQTNIGKEFHPLVSQAMAYVENHLKEDLSIPVICEKLHVGESSFTKLFKNETGTSMIKYINSIRIERACYLLSSSELQVQEIASEVGIDNPNYFSILFKKATGISPNEYRASHC